MKILKRHPIACAFLLLTWILVFTSVASDPTFDSAPMVLFTILPLVYLEPHEREKTKGWIVTGIFAVTTVSAVYLLSVSTIWEELREASWFVWTFVAVYLGFQIHKLSNWEKKYKEGMRRFFDRTTENK